MSDKTISECCECGWKGAYDEMDRVRDPQWKDIVVHTYVCPKCQSDEFYRDGFDTDELDEEVQS